MKQCKIYQDVKVEKLLHLDKLYQNGRFLHAKLIVQVSLREKFFFWVNERWKVSVSFRQEKWRKKCTWSKVFETSVLSSRKKKLKKYESTKEIA